MDLSTTDADIAQSRALLWRKIPIEILVALLAPLVLLFVPRSWDRMPADSWLRYWQDYHYGINGDPYWQAQHGEACRGWWRRVAWVWRNANYWDHEHGVRPADLVLVEWTGEPRVGNRPLVEGDLAIHAWDKDGRRYWCYYRVRKWWLPGRCARSVIGWKLKDVLDEQRADGVLNNDPNQRPLLQAVYTWNPLMGYSE